MLSAADLATDVASGAMGRVTGMLIGTAAQGGLAAYRMSRFGLLAIGVCRPMPFSQAMAPTVADVMKKAWSGGEAGEPEAKHDCRKD
jgi:putative membrane protein